MTPMPQLVFETVPLRVSSQSKFAVFEGGVKYLILCTGGFQSKKKLVLSFYGSSSPSWGISKRSHKRACCGWSVSFVPLWCC